MSEDLAFLTSSLTSCPLPSVQKSRDALGVPLSFPARPTMSAGSTCTGPGPSRRSPALTGTSPSPHRPIPIPSPPHPHPLTATCPSPHLPIPSLPPPHPLSSTCPSPHRPIATGQPGQEMPLAWKEQPDLPASAAGWGRASETPPPSPAEPLTGSRGRRPSPHAPLHLQGVHSAGPSDGAAPRCPRHRLSPPPPPPPPRPGSPGPRFPGGRSGEPPPGSPWQRPPRRPGRPLRPPPSAAAPAQGRVPAPAVPPQRRGSGVPAPRAVPARPLSQRRSPRAPLLGFFLILLPRERPEHPQLGGSIPHMPARGGCPEAPLLLLLLRLLGVNGSVRNFSRHAGFLRNGRRQAQHERVEGAGSPDVELGAIPDGDVGRDVLVPNAPAAPLPPLPCPRILPAVPHRLPGAAAAPQGSPKAPRAATARAGSHTFIPSYDRCPGTGRTGRRENHGASPW